MVKILTLLWILCLTSVASGRAFSINCESPQGFTSHGRGLDVRATGRWETLGFGQTLLSYQVSLGIDCGAEGLCWTKTQSTGSGVIANSDYRPTRYQNYQQFTLQAPQPEEYILLLPELAPPGAASFSAYLMLRALHGSYGATVPLRCQGETVDSFSSSIPESASAELARADRIIQEDFDFKNLRLQADEEALQKQMTAGKSDVLTLSQATQLALAEILDDFQSIEAPLNIAADGWASTYHQTLKAELTKAQKIEIRRFLREQMQSPKTKFSLYLGTTVKGEIYPPEQGESIQDNWIFVLHVPTLSDHIYWVIIDRQGKKAPYLYGFN